MHVTLKTVLDPFNRHSPQVVDCLLNEGGGAGLVSRLAYSASGTWLAVASTAARKGFVTVSIFDLLAGSKLLSFDPYPLEGNLVEFIWCDNSTIIAATSDGILYIFDPHQGRSPQRLELPEMASAVVSIAPFYHDNELVLLLQSGSLITSRGVSVLNGPPNLSLIDSTLVGCGWHEASRLAFMATSKSIIVADLRSKKVIPLNDGHPPLTLGSVIQAIAVDQSGSRLGITMKDKSIRIVSVDKHVGEEKIVEAITLTPTLKLFDAVNRWPWSMVGFSQDGELVWGSFREPGRHLVYLWDAHTGSMVRILEGPREELITMAWNPRRPALVTAGSMGTLFHWIPDYPVKWAALVPGLEDIEENVVYQEREDEFDLPVEEELAAQRRRATAAQFDEPIDVVSRDRNEIFVERLPLCTDLGEET